MIQLQIAFTQNGFTLIRRWTVPTRRSVTWLLYLNDRWQPNEGGALRTYPRKGVAHSAVGSHLGNLQVSLYVYLSIYLYIYMYR